MKRWCLILAFVVRMAVGSEAHADALHLMPTNTGQSPPTLHIHLLPGSGGDVSCGTRLIEMGLVSMAAQNAIMGLAGYIAYQVDFRRGAGSLTESRQTSLILAGMMLDVYVLPAVTSAIVLQMSGLGFSCASFALVAALSMVANVAVGTLAFALMLSAKTNLVSAVLLSMELAMLGNTIAAMGTVALISAFRHVPLGMATQEARPEGRVPEPNDSPARATAPLLAFAF